MTTPALRVPAHLACPTRIERLALRFAAVIHTRALSHMDRRLQRASRPVRTTTVQREHLLARHAEQRRDAVARAHSGLLP